MQPGLSLLQHLTRLVYNLVKSLAYWTILNEGLMQCDIECVADYYKLESLLATNTRRHSQPGLDFSYISGQLISGGLRPLCTSVQSHQNDHIMYCVIPSLVC